MKYGNEPARFIESELDLDEEIKSLQVIATAPQLYPVLVKLGAVKSLLRLLAHDNTDICIAVIKLLADLTEPDTIAESEKSMTFVEALVANQALELLVDNLGRLDEKSEDDARGVYHTMAIFENLCEDKVCSYADWFTNCIAFAATTWLSYPLFLNLLSCIYLAVMFLVAFCREISMHKNQGVTLAT